ncbi:phospholipase [Geodermatophilus sp. SYSU D00742]
MWTRRRVLVAGGRLTAAGLLAGCGVPLPAGPSSAGRGAAAVLSARPGSGFPLPPRDVAAGTGPLGLGVDREPLLHVPPGVALDRPVPLVVTLHGAGGDAAGGLALLQQPADERGLLLLAPASRGPTWDAVTGGYGPDAELLDQALARVFAVLPVDPRRVAVAGFSDGASYALGLGLANGGLLARVVAFSPGFVPVGPRDGRPEVFVSHGDRDDVLPIARTSRRLVPGLRDAGIDVTYREFSGGHVVPPEVVQEAVDWLTRP